MKYLTTAAFLVLGCIAVLGQALLNLSVNLNANGKALIAWTTPTMSAILQESTSLSSTGSWQTTTLNILPNGCPLCPRSVAAAERNVKLLLCEARLQFTD